MIGKVGVTQQNMYDTPDRVYASVASSDISKLIIYYTDVHDVDEDVRTIADQGGMWFDGNQVGITNRSSNEASTDAWNGVASVCRHLRNL